MSLPQFRSWSEGGGRLWAASLWSELLRVKIKMRTKSASPAPASEAGWHLPSHRSKQRGETPCLLRTALLDSCLERSFLWRLFTWSKQDESPYWHFHATADPGVGETRIPTRTERTAHMTRRHSGASAEKVLMLWGTEQTPSSKTAFPLLSQEKGSLKNSLDNTIKIWCFGSCFRDEGYCLESLKFSYRYCVTRCSGPDTLATYIFSNLS